MEQKKTLWIIAATGVFLLVVIGAAMLLYSPSNYNTPAVASLPPVRQNPSGGWVPPAAETIPEQNPVDLNSLNVPQAQTAAPQIIVEKDEKSENTNAQPQIVDNLTVISNSTNFYDASGKTTTIDLNTLKDAAVANNEAKASEEIKKQETVTVKPTEKKVAKAAPVTPAVKKSAPLTPKYWVQAASFPEKNKADKARSILSENKIPAEVFTYTNSKKDVYYRVRVGPYTTKSEAEYWKSKIIEINEFKDSKSYITDSSAAK